MERSELKLFTHTCKCCEKIFDHPKSRQELFDTYKSYHPNANPSRIYVFCPDCLTQIGLFPDKPFGNYLYSCKGCGVFVGKPKDIAPVIRYTPGVPKDGADKVCEDCYTKALSMLN